jgi:toxin ParE1/3/4
MATILRRPRASADLSEIWEFIAQDNIEQADAFIDRIDEKFRALAEQPLMGRERRELGPGIRSIAMAPYVIFYEALPDGVMIVRVLHGARDVEAEFKED